jgi:Holliday junction resolvase
LATKPLAGELTEEQWQQRVVTFATLNGWRSYHTFDSRRSDPGFPDLVMIRDGVLIVAELKTDKGKVTKAQMEWLALFASVQAQTNAEIGAYIWRPSEWATIQRILARRQPLLPSQINEYHV